MTHEVTIKTRIDLRDFVEDLTAEQQLCLVSYVCSGDAVPIQQVRDLVNAPGFDEN